MMLEQKIRQTSSEATEAIAHLAEDAIGSITSTVTFFNVRAELHNIVRENLPANGGVSEMIFGRSKTQHAQAEQK